MPSAAPLGHLPAPFRALVMGASAVTFCALTLILTPHVGDLVSGLVMPMLLLAGVFYGPPAVILVWIAWLPVNLFAYQLAGASHSLVTEIFSSFLGLVAAGAFIALLRLWDRLRSEVQAGAVSEAKFRATFDSAAVGTMLVGANWFAEQVNDTYCRLTGQSREDSLKMDFSKDHSEARKIIERDLALQGHSTYTTESLRADGSMWWGEWHIAYILGASGLPEGGVVQVVDITTRKRAEDALRRSERLAAVGTLVAGVAHEINNPLMFVRGNLELVEMGLLEQKEAKTLAQKDAEDLLTKVRRSMEGLDGLRRLAQDLRKVTRPSTAPRKKEDLNEIVRSVANAQGAPRRGVALDLGGEACVVANAEELRQIVLSLVMNAHDAIAEKGEHISLRTRDDGVHVSLEVTDDGPGIDPDVASSLFTPFFTTKAQGTGLGLTISHAIAREHGGDLTFVSAPGRTTFRLELPVAPKVLA